jgi:hypothetical protein
MSPQKQASQIANAQKSHGPATEAGLARSSQNSIRHSLCSKKYFIVPEERPEFDLYYGDLLAALAPEGALESKLAESIVMDEWRLTRARQVENQIFCRGYMSAKPEEQFISSAETWLAHSRELATLTLYEQRINRVLTRNKAEFASLQSARVAVALPADSVSANQSQSPEAPEPTAQPAASKQETAASDQPAGFVHSSAVPAPTPEPEPQTEAAKLPVGFVRSSSPIAPAEKSATPVNEPETAVEPVLSPPEAARRAA